LDALVKKALENRAEIKSLKSTIQITDAVVQVAREAKLPQVFLIGNYNLAKPNQRIFPFQDKFISTWDVNVIASFDIWNWHATSHQVTQARAQHMQAEDGLALLKDAITLEINQNYLALVQAKEKIKVAGEGVVQAEENHRMTNERFKAGMALNSELLDAEVALLQAKVNQTQAFIDYEIAKAKLDKSIGKSK
jgi:outer membrane protein TolC